MNLQQIRNGVKDLIEDDGYDGELDMFINMAYLQAVNEPGIRIPSLKGLSVVLTNPGMNTAYILQDNPSFSGKLLRCGDPTKVTIFESLETLFDEYQHNGVLKDDEGDVEAVALEGNVLWYQCVPAESTPLTIIYYRDPPELIDNTDVPAFLPVLTHEEILVYGAAAKIANRQEDGIEGPKVNTSAFLSIYNRGIASLRVWLSAKRKPVNRSVWDV